MENQAPATANTMVNTTPVVKPPPVPSLSSCSAVELGNFLKHRFAADGLTKFMAELNGSCGTTPAAPITPAPSTPTLTIPDSFGGLIFKAPKVQFITPRGRFDVAVYERGVEVKNAKGEGFLISDGDATHAVAFAKPDNYNKDPNKVTSRMLLLNLKAPAPFKKSSLTTICVQAETNYGVFYTAPKKEEGVKDESDRPSITGSADSGENRVRRMDG